MLLEDCGLIGDQQAAALITLILAARASSKAEADPDLVAG
jgi:hypothetical protein